MCCLTSYRFVLISPSPSYHIQHHGHSTKKAYDKSHSTPETTPNARNEYLSLSLAVSSLVVAVSSLPRCFSFGFSANCRDLSWRVPSIYGSHQSHYNTDCHRISLRSSIIHPALFPQAVPFRSLHPLRQREGERGGGGGWWIEIEQTLEWSGEPVSLDFSLTYSLNSLSDIQ